MLNRVAVMLALLVVGSSAQSRMATTEPIPAGLLHVRQTGPERDYVIFGARNASVSQSVIDAVYADGTSEFLGLSTPGGGFAFRVPYQSAKDGIAVRAQSPGLEPGTTTSLRLDYPMQPTFGRAPNERGFVQIVPATADVEVELTDWIQAFHSRTDPAQIPNVDRLKRTKLPESELVDVVVYGYSPDGDKATCIIGPTGYSIATTLQDGRFQIRVPKDEIVQSENRGWTPATFIVTITTEQNDIVATTSINPWPNRLTSRR
jgi:hypothetical protein